jgi:hypothetical protein
MSKLKEITKEGKNTNFGENPRAFCLRPIHNYKIGT